MTLVKNSEQNYHHGMILADAWVPSASPERVEVIDASTEDVIGSAPRGSRVDVDRAVTAARSAFPEWSGQTVAHRADRLRALAAGLADRREELAHLIAREVGSPITLSRAIQVDFAIQRLRDTADMVEAYVYRVESDYEYAGRAGTTALVREPFGVVAVITPWNFPLLEVIGKIGPALGVGNTVVVKPSELAPLSVYALAEVAAEVGLGGGVLTLVGGVGEISGAALAAHEHVDFVTFTGSTAVGRSIGAAAAQTVTNVSLELGGKGPNIVLADADLPAAAQAILGDAFYNNGQTCSALTRVIVHRSQQSALERLLVEAAAALTVGPAEDERTDLGPLISERQQAKVFDYIQSGLEQGARLITPDKTPKPSTEPGFFVPPTIFSDVTPGMRIHDEEIFGPVLVIATFDDEQEAITLAHDTPYGLSAGVWSADRDTALRIAGKLQAGQVFVNGAPPNPFAPFGGYRQSGIGRKVGLFGLEEFLEIKAIQY